MSKYCPTNAKDDYLYYVEGYRHPTTAPARNNMRWERNVYESLKCPPSANYIRRPCSTSINQVLYCNPRFTANSQATIPFDSEAEDYRFRDYGMQRKLAHGPARTSRWTTNIDRHAMNSLYEASPRMCANNPASILKKTHLESYDTLPNKHHGYTYGPNANEYYPCNTNIDNDLYTETEESESDLATEDEYTESENSSFYNKYKPKTDIKSKEKEIVFSSSKDRGDKNTRSGMNVDNMMKHINGYNRYQPGRKMKLCDLETIVQQLKKEPVKDQKYVYKNSRCLESSYTKAAEVLKTAKSNAEAVQHLKTEQNKYDPYQEYRRKQYSQLLLADTKVELKDRKVALGCDTKGNVYLGSQKHIKQISSQYSVLKPKSQEKKDAEYLKCSPIPEERQADVVDIKSTKKTPDNEQPVKLQKETSEPIRFSSNTSFLTQSKKMTLISKDKLSIYRKSRRIPRRKRNFVGIYSCAKALKKFSEYSQIAIQKQLGVALTSTKEDKTPGYPKLNLSLKADTEKAVDKKQSLVEVRSSTKPTKNENLKETPSNEIHKSQVAMNVDSMISKLNEIENLINKKKNSFTKRESSTSKSTFNIGEVTSTSNPNSTTEFLSENTNCTSKRSKRCPLCEISIPENRKTDTDGTAKTNDGLTNTKGSNKQVSFMSTKSAIQSLISVASTKLLSSNRYDSTDAEVFKSVFNELDSTTHHSKSTRKCDGSSCRPLTKKSESSSDTSSDNNNSTRAFKKPSNRFKKPSSVVTVFPASNRNFELTAESTTTNQVSETIDNKYDNVKKVSKIPKPKRSTKTEDSSSDNTSCIVRPKYKGKKRITTIERVSEENQVTRHSLLSSLRSAFSVIVNFFFRYFRNLFIF